MLALSVQGAVVVKAHRVQRRWTCPPSCRTPSGKAYRVAPGTLRGAASDRRVVEPCRLISRCCVTGVVGERLRVAVGPANEPTMTGLSRSASSAVKGCNACHANPAIP